MKFVQMLRSHSMANVTSSDNRLSTQLGRLPPQLSGSAFTLPVERSYGGLQTPISGSTLSLAQGLPNFRLLPRMGRVPIPERTEAMFNAAKRGLRECIENSDNQLLRLQSCSGSYSHHCENLERFKTRLQQRLGLVEDLETDYKHLLALREKARQKSGTLRPPTELSYKTCCERLCSVEAQFEYMLGTLKCQIGELSGFARLCPGDCFELSIRYGAAKWKSRVRIDRRGRQHWENASAIFSPSVRELLHIRASEVKIFRHRSTLGEKSCEIKELLAGDPRCLSINLNAVGTLKLSLICEWCPLAEWQESEVDNSSLLLYYTPTHRPSRIAGGTCSSTPAGMIPHPTGDSNGSCSASAGATPVERHRYSMLLCDSDDESEAAAVTESHSASPSGPGSVSASVSAHSFPTTAPPSIGPAVHCGGRSRDLPTVLDASPPRGDMESRVHLCRLVRMLLSQLDDVRGEHVVYEGLEDALRQLGELLRVEERAMVRSQTAPCRSNIAADEEGIEFALDRAFDFLEEEDEGDLEEEEERHNRHTSPLSTTRTQSNDSGLFMPPSTVSSAPHPPVDLPRATFARDASCGWPVLDPVLTWHLVHTHFVLQRLVSTPFKDFASRQVSCLEDQGRALVAITRALSDAMARGARFGQQLSLVPANVQDCMDLAAVSCRELKHFWIKCLANDNPLLMSFDSMRRHLTKSYAEQVKKKFELDFSQVMDEFSEELRHCYHDSSFCNRSEFLTLFHFFSQFSEVSLEKAVMDKAREVWIRSCLSASNESVLTTTLENQLFTVPPACWPHLTALLSHPTGRIRKAARTRIQRLTSSSFKRKTAIHCLVELGLSEAADAAVRVAACVGLQQLRATEVTSELVWCSQRDANEEVRLAARDALLGLGDLGRKAYDTGQRSLHGFQSAAPPLTTLRPNITTSFT